MQTSVEVKEDSLSFNLNNAKDKDDLVDRQDMTGDKKRKENRQCNHYPTNVGKCLKDTEDELQFVEYLAFLSEKI